MDPEVRQIGPGACPKCGMALEPVSAAPLTKTEWTCPMHPEIVRDEPGSCPICGMALEPRVVTLEEQNPELDDMTRRFRWSLVLTAPILAFMISEFLPGQPLQHALPPACDDLVAVPAGDAGRAVGRLAVLRPRLGVGGEPSPEHVHADRPGRGRGVCVQRRRDAGAGPVSRIVPHARRSDRRLLRAGRGDRRARAARPGAGAARAQSHQLRHQEAAWA